MKFQVIGWSVPMLEVSSTSSAQALEGQLVVIHGDRIFVVVPANPNPC
jgi:hypothetical protein